MSQHEPGAESLPQQVAINNSLDQVPKQARQFQGHRAGIVTRVAANSVDFAVVIGLLVGTYVTWFAVLFIVNTTSFTPPRPTFRAVLLIGFAYLWLYLTVAWAATGRTFGDWLMGLRVVNYKGDRVRWVGAFLRSTFCVFFIPGLFWVAISPSNRSVQDIVLRTSVIYDWSRRMPEVPEF